jgi:hypothetical protein
LQAAVRVHESAKALSCGELGTRYRVFSRGRVVAEIASNASMICSIGAMPGMDGKCGGVHVGLLGFD